MVDAQPVVARIIIDDSGVTGLGRGGGGSQENTETKETNKLLNELLRQFGLSTGMGGVVTSAVTGAVEAVGAVITAEMAGIGSAVATAVAGAIVVGGGLGAGNLGTEGQAGYIPPTTDPDTAEAIAEANGITLELVQQQNEGLSKGQDTITNKQVPLSNEVATWFSKNYDVLVDTNTGLLTVQKKIEDSGKSLDDTDTAFTDIDTYAKHAANGLKDLGDAAYEKASVIRGISVGVGIENSDGTVTIGGKTYETGTNEGNLAAIDAAANG